MLLDTIVVERVLTNDHRLARGDTIVYEDGDAFVLLEHAVKDRSHDTWTILCVAAPSKDGYQEGQIYHWSSPPFGSSLYQVLRGDASA